MSTSHCTFVQVSGYVKSNRTCKIRRVFWLCISLGRAVAFGVALADGAQTRGLLWRVTFNEIEQKTAIGSATHYGLDGTHGTIQGEGAGQKPSPVRYGKITSFSYACIRRSCGSKPFVDIYRVFKIPFSFESVGSIPTTGTRVSGETPLTILQVCFRAVSLSLSQLGGASLAVKVCCPPS